MRKTTVALLAVLIFAAGYRLDDLLKHVRFASMPKPGPSVRVPNVKPEVIANLKKVTVLISNEGFGSVGRGTGVLIDDQHVVTCAHLISSVQDDLWLYLFDGTMVKGKPIAGSLRKDVAIIKLDRKVHLPFTPVFQIDTVPGEPMAILGNALGAMKWYVSGGVVSGTHRDYLLSDAFQIGGNSGGPWINQKGEIIGLAAWGYQKKNGDRIGINGAISAATVVKFIWETRNPPQTFGEMLRRMADN